VKSYHLRPDGFEQLKKKYQAFSALFALGMGTICAIAIQKQDGPSPGARVIIGLVAAAIGYAIMKLVVVLMAEGGA
jgi:hypothetical protein